MACGTDCFFVASSAAAVHVAGALEQMPRFGDVHSLYLVKALYPENQNSVRRYQIDTTTGKFARRAAVSG
jgi:hypothetical protein